MSSTACSARIGPPAAMRPSIGTYAGAGRCARAASSSASPGARTSTARGRFGSRRRKPFFSSSLSW